MTLVIGGTRGTGFLIASLLQSKSAPVRVLARNPSAAIRQFPRGVEVVAGDITSEHTLPRAVEGTRHIILTAGVPSGHPATEALIKATEYDGVVNVLTTVRHAGFKGRFLYMTSSGVTIPSVSASLLNLYKGNTLTWRLRSEDEIRASGLDYTIIRAGVLLNREPGRHAVRVTQESLPLSWRYRIARADVADAFVAALDHPCASRATFDVVWDKGPRHDAWNVLLDRLHPDAPANTVR